VERPVARDPIAIIGMGCRLPGADSVDRFWTLLRDGVDAIGELPLDRFDIDTLFDPRPGTPGAVVTRAGGFLPDIDRFDPLFFGISPREAAVIDPQQRLLLEVAWEALDDAGMPRAALAGCLGGVFVAMWTNEYEDRLLASREDLDVHVATGSGRYTAAGRLSNFFDLRGPSLTVDTACSSSLVAVHLACEALRNHQVPIALAGSAIRSSPSATRSRACCPPTGVASSATLGPTATCAARGWPRSC
jgi:acyl transferase domain-containing protein